MKTYILSLFTTIFFLQTFAQEKDGLSGKLGLTGAKPDATYIFDGNMTQRVTMTNKKGKQTWIDNQIYFGKNEAYIGTKLAGSNDPSMEKNLGMMELTVVDLAKSRIFNFMNTNGSKMVMGIGFKGDKLTETIEKENAKITVSKTDKTKTIMGYACDGYAVKNDKDGTEVMMWVSQKSIPQMARLGHQMAKAYSGQGKQTNYMAYNAHPEFVKIAKDGRGVLGYSSTTDKGETTEMEITKLNPSESFTFKSGDYKSMF
jgi:hypothetical protein